MSSAHKTRKSVYAITLFFIALTGFAQMPIFKRYYIADIPGLGWLAQFYVTHAMHYILAVIFIALCVYGVMDFILTQKGDFGITASGKIKAALILGLVVTGGLMVVRNLPGVYFSHTLIYVMDIGHIGLCMALFMVSAYTLVKKKTWIQ
jgi:hypothetical protein